MCLNVFHFYTNRFNLSLQPLVSRQYMRLSSHQALIVKDAQRQTDKEIPVDLIHVFNSYRGWQKYL